MLAATMPARPPAKSRAPAFRDMAAPMPKPTVTMRRFTNSYTNDDVPVPDNPANNTTQASFAISSSLLF